MQLQPRTPDARRAHIDVFQLNVIRQHLKAELVPGVSKSGPMYEQSFLPPRPRQGHIAHYVNAHGPGRKLNQASY